MKKINIFLILSVTAIILLLPSYVSAASKELVYLRIDNVTTSSFDDTADWAPPPEPRAVIDGDLLSRWSSNYTDNQWVSLDFGKTKVIERIVIFWEAAYAVDYDILTSEDNKNWQVLLSLTNQDGGIDKIEFAPQKARFIKIIGRKRFNPDWGISIWELLCFGPADENPDDKPLCSVYPKLANKLAEDEIAEVEMGLEEPQDSPGVLSLDEFQKGVVYTSWSRDELGTEASDRTLEYLKELGVRHLGIMIVWIQDSIEESRIYPDPKDTPEDNALIHAINKAHSLGIKVMLKPHVDVKTGEWRGDIIPSREWFLSYKDYLMHYAELAEEYNVELFNIGTELANATLPQWEAQWEDIIQQIRSVFSGRLVYGANWDDYKIVGFWDKLDFIGISAYFPLTAERDPDKDELIAAWQSNILEVEEWLQKEGLEKPVIFTEVGYCSADGANMHPWKVLSNLSDTLMDEQEQADCLEAMLTACSTRRWFRGFYWWNYFPQERWSPLGYIIRGKRAEEILIEWFKKI